MLLIAQPKSASTSLTKTLEIITKLKCYYGIPRKTHNIDCEEFLEIQKYHDNMCQRNGQFMKNVSQNRKIIFKEHLLPTLEHLEFLNKYKENIVILLRYPEDSLDSYLRMFKKNGRKDFNKKELLSDLRNFHDRYMWWASNKRYAIVIYYRDLIKDYKTVMYKILKHYNIKSKRLIPLKKLKYTGVGEKRIGREV